MIAATEHFRAFCSVACLGFKDVHVLFQGRKLKMLFNVSGSSILLCTQCRKLGRAGLSKFPQSAKLN